MEELKEQVKYSQTPSANGELRSLIIEEEKAEPTQPYLPSVSIPGIIVEPFIEQIFKPDEDKRMKAKALVVALRETFPRLNSVILQYFESRTVLHPDFTSNQILYDPPIAPHLPEATATKLLNPGSLAMLYLSISKLKGTKMTRLYNS